LKSGLQRAGIRVDEIVGNREVVVKTIGPQLSRLSAWPGATCSETGRSVLILNPVQLVHREAAPEDIAAPGAQGPRGRARGGADLPAPALIMVVDDSLTVRKITSRMLTREGYEVATAKDGVDALQQLQDIKPDCILLDVEMPRMDGLRIRPQRARRRSHARDPDHHDHLALGGQAPQPRARDRRERIHGQALPGRTAPGAHQALHRGAGFA
jgi:chemosensory pili system protein ChpA (sensor histidine kinase/response regulator)